MTENKIYKYNNKEITFQLTGREGVMINATQMIKAFEGKRINNYLRMEETQELVRALIRRKSPSIGETLFSASLSINELANIDNSILKVVKGGLGEQGTWMCEDLALDFAQWLSVDFKLWCNDRIKELLTIGFTATPTTLEDILTNPDLIIGLASKLKEARQEIEILKPKADYYDHFVESGYLTSFRDTAKEFNLMGEQEFISLLERNRYLYRDQFNQLKPYSKHVQDGIFEMRDFVNKTNGVTGIQTLITAKGKQVLLNKLNDIKKAAELEEIRKNYNELDREIFKATQEKGRTLTREEYLALGGERLEELRSEWNKLSPDVSMEVINKTKEMENVLRSVK
jgi:toxin-antitoxin system, toxin component, bro domain protein|nr:MAG TPA: KilA protein [Bacteriophage sp.]